MLLPFMPVDADDIDADVAVAAADDGRASGAIIRGGGGRGVLRQLRPPRPASFFQPLRSCRRVWYEASSAAYSAKTNENAVFAVVVVTMMAIF